MKIKDRIKSLRRVPAGQLLPNPKNWRTHPEAQQEAMRGVLAEVGFADAVLARETPDGLMLIDGHLRAEVAPEAKVPVLVLDVTEEEADKILATHDPLAAMAGVDTGRLEGLLEGVAFQSESAQALLDQMLAQHGLLPEESSETSEEDEGKQLDQAEALQQKWQTEPGQLWQIFGKQDHRLLCGDSTRHGDADRLLAGEQAHCLWTDPPYGVSYEGKTKDQLKIRNDGVENLESLLQCAFAVANRILVEGAAIYIAHPAGKLSLKFGQEFCAINWHLHETLVWVKDCMVLGHSDYHYKHEPILYGWKGRKRRWYGDRSQVSVFEVARPKRSAKHPTMKPVELIMSQLKNSTRPGDLVYDPFAGSGSTLVAAETLGRRCAAIEIDPKYVAVILQRLTDLGAEATLSKE